jgi:hypothetical protein
MPARNAYYNLLSQIKLFELKKRTTIRMYAQEKIPALQPIAQVTDIDLRFPDDVKHYYIIAQVTYRL